MLVDEGPRGEHLRRSRPTRPPPRSSGRAAGGRSSRRGRSRPSSRTSRPSGRSSNFPRLLFNTAAIAILSTIGGGALVGPRRLRVRALPVPRQEHAVHHPDRDDHPAVPGDPHPDLRHLHEARLERHVAAADHPAPVRERLQRVPAAPVLHVDPARPGRGRDDRRRRPVPDPAVGHPAAVRAGDRGGGLFHFFFAWNDFFVPLLYLVASRSSSRCPSPSSSTTRSTSTQPTLIQAAAL